MKRKLVDGRSATTVPPNQSCLNPGNPVHQDSPLALKELFGIFADMSAQQIIEQIKALPPGERAQVAKFVMEEDESWVPEEFREGMADIAAGRVLDLDTALTEPYPGDK